ncbi:hypothetical protein FKG94_00495 [Exilibacterium tricleocarpae]|uniref:Lipoprotein n=1 Tax=Exilibacterium tricleocarpae TaxID=2591008 RepID=A0A545U9C7_9GAMM|nr:hypothetical protein [Exilibacterium tricleocarpae]TQV86074.1 hypothetical protein FKG94_00495 [Exilibacterium tricleocarpae]
MIRSKTMRIGLLACVSVLTLMTGCATVKGTSSGTNNAPVGGTLAGTDTAPVRISLDKEGMPQVDIETVVVKVGQRVVFVGPTEFTINFPEDTPFDRQKFETGDAVINLVIPQRVKRKFQQNIQEIKFKYDVIVGDKVLDPHMIVIL